MKHKEIVRFVIFVFILALATFLLFPQINQALDNPESVRDKISYYGSLAPLLFISFSVIEVVIAIVPGQAVNLVGGYVFGILFGVIYNLIGVLLGLFIVFSMSKRFGRPFVEKVVNKKYLDKFDYITHRQGIIPLFLLFFIPIFPSDAIAYLAGLTGLRMRVLLPIAFLARIPGTLVFTAIGSGVSVRNPFIILVIAVILIISFVLYFKREKIMYKMKNVN